jgi:TPR repeat protein
MGFCSLGQLLRCFANCSAALPTGKLVTKRIVAGALLIPLAMPAWTDFQDGLEAAQRGDFETAFREWQPLSEQGNAEAQFSLGFMYRRGDGVPQDYVQAHMWYNLAAAQGLEVACENRDIVAFMMTPSQIEEAQRLAREWLAAHP